MFIIYSFVHVLFVKFTIIKNVLLINFFVLNRGSKEEIELELPMSQIVQVINLIFVDVLMVV